MDLVNVLTGATSDGFPARELKSIYESMPRAVASDVVQTMYVQMYICTSFERAAQ